MEETDIINRFKLSMPMVKTDFQKLKKQKDEAKEVLFKRCWPNEKTNIPLVVIFDPKDLAMREVLHRLMEGLLVLPIKVIVVSAVEKPDLVKHPTGKITWVNTENGRNNPEIEKYLTAADMAVLFEEHILQIENIMKKGVVIIANRKSPLLQNYHPNNETGNSFTFDSNNPWDIFMALVRALETFKFPYDWDNIVRGLVKHSIKDSD
jgi:hypothetical protein